MVSNQLQFSDPESMYIGNQDFNASNLLPYAVMRAITDLAYLCIWNHYVGINY